MGMFVLLDCVYVHSLYVLYLRRPDEGIEFPGTGVTGTVGDLAWALATELGSSTTAHTLNHYSL